MDAADVLQATTSAALQVDIEEIDAAVEAAIRAGHAGDLRVLGYGELTLVLGWPTATPAYAVKRLPMLRERARLERYDALVRRYIETLEQRGVSVVATQLRWGGGDGALRPYLVQPLVPRRALLNRVLQRCTAREAEPLLTAVARAIAVVVDERVGLDAQVANWAVEGEHITLLDVSTPLLRDALGRDELDVDLFLSIYPWALRPPLRRIARHVMSQYFQPRGVLVDVASNLVKERLDHWLGELLGAAETELGAAVGEPEVYRYFTADRRLWLTMQRLRRVDRAWQRRVRRRPYPFLLVPPYAYGPPELADEEDP